MPLGITATALLGSLACWWGIRFGRVLLSKGATANDLFQGKNGLSLVFLGLYIVLLVVVLHVPQMQELPMAVRLYGMEITWTIMRIMLMGICGVAFMVSWRTAPVQVLPIILIGVLGLWGFTSAESYFLAPIHGQLQDDLEPNGVFHQSSSSSCAPAALATILHRWGMDATESTVAQLARTTRLGTSMPQLIRAARAYGMEGLELSPTWEQMQAINRPGVLATWLLSTHGRQAHAVALLALSDDVATIADPAFGKIYYVPRSQFTRIWRNQYVPIFRPTDQLLAPERAAAYLEQLGLLKQATTVRFTSPSPALPTQNALEVDDTVLGEAVRRFQSGMGIEPTGKLDPQTVLMLSGPFLQDVPTLKSLNTAL